MEDLERRLEAQAFAGPMVDLPDMGLKLLPGDLAQVGAFGQILA